MARIADVLTEELAACSVELTPTRLETLLIDYALDGDALYSRDKAPALKRAVLDCLTRLLAMPDLTEGGLSLRWDRSAVTAYVDRLRAELDPSDTTAPRIIDRSSLW